MLKTLMISAAVSALMVSGALAQADMSKQPAAKTDAAPAVPHDTAKFIAAQGTDQWVFSKFKGTDVLGPDNAHIVSGGAQCILRTSGASGRRRRHRRSETAGAYSRMNVRSHHAPVRRRSSDVVKR